MINPSEVQPGPAYAAAFGMLTYRADPEVIDGVLAHGTATP